MCSFWTTVFTRSLLLFTSLAAHLPLTLSEATPPAHDTDPNADYIDDDIPLDDVVPLAPPVSVSSLSPPEPYDLSNSNLKHTSKPDYPQPVEVLPATPPYEEGRGQTDLPDDVVADISPLQKWEERKILLDHLHRTDSELHVERVRYNQAQLDEKWAAETLKEERLLGLETSAMLLKTWIDVNSLEYWEELERVNERVAEQQTSLTDLMYYMEYEKQSKSLDAYSLTLDYIEDLAQLQGEVMALRVRAQADRNEWTFRFQEMMIATELQDERCKQEVQRLDDQVQFIMDLIQDLLRTSNYKLGLDLLQQ